MKSQSPEEGRLVRPKYRESSSRFCLKMFIFFSLGIAGYRHFMWEDSELLNSRKRTFPLAATDTFITCSRLSDSDEGAKVKGARKVGRAGKREKGKGERACNHFLYDPLPPTFGTFEIIRFWLSNCWCVNDLESSSNFSPPFLLPVSCCFFSCSRFLNSADPTISEGQHLRNRY